MNSLHATARTLMTAPALVIDANQTLHCAASMMISHHVHALVVTRTDGRSPGVVTLKDIVQTLSVGDPKVLHELLVADAMTSPAITVRSEMLIVDCLALMRMTGVRMVPVTEGDAYVGVLSYTDIVRAAIAQAPTN